MTFVNRDPELAALRDLMADGRPRLVLVHGRRRVGKTFLLGHAFPPETAFTFTASATTPEQNRLQLIREFAEWIGVPLRTDDFQTWRTVFRLLIDPRQYAQAGATVPAAVVLDEFQYFGDDERGLAAVASELNAVWEQRRAPRALVFVLAGSAIRTMEALAAAAAPLYGRFAWKAEIKPFDYWHAGRMTEFRQLRDRAAAYGIFGGTPTYLAALKPGLSLATNATRLMLAPRAEVRELVATAVIQEQGLRDIPKYTAVLRAIASGCTELNPIAQASGLPLDSSLRDKVERLVGLGYVRTARNLGAKRTTPFRYYLADPAFRFYYRFVAPNEAVLEHTAPRDVWRERVAPVLDTYLGSVFERLVEQAYVRLREKHRLPIVAEWGRWEGRDRDGQAVEMDIACTLADGRSMTGAVKWNRRPLPPSVHEQHLAMLDRLAASGVPWAHQARERSSPLLYVAAGGFTREFAAAARRGRDRVTLWTLKDLYTTVARTRAK